MFCLEKKTIKLISIIETLDRLTEPITAINLAKEIEYGTSSTILSMAKEIKEIIENVYDQSTVRLIINYKGIFLIRKSSNLNELFNQILSHDLGYEVIKALITECRVNTHKFCLSFGVSDSTLKRKIKLLNNLVGTYNFHITCSNNISIKGNELNFLIFSFIFFSSIHPQLSEVNWIQGKIFYMRQAQEIENYLTNDFLCNRLKDTQMELLSFWVYLLEISNTSRRKLSFSKEQQKIIDFVEIVKKPSFLNKWSSSNWEFLLVALYCFQLSDFPVNDRFFKDIEITSHQQKFGEYFVQLFETHFILLSLSQKRRLHSYLKRLYVADTFMRVDQKIFPTLNYNHIILLKDRYPCYTYRFEKFFDEISLRYPKLKKGDIKIKILRICFDLYPISNTITKLNVCYVSSLYSNFDNVAKENLKIHFANKYRLYFTDDLDEADLIISTTNQNIFTHQQIGKTVFIRSPFLDKDLKNIDIALKKMKESIFREGG